MRLFHWLLLLFFAVPLAEIYVLLEVGAVVGVLETVFLVVFTAVLGAVLIRAQGFSTLMRVHSSLDRGEVPAVPIMEGAFLLVAGALLLTPGFLTDTVGFLCLVPPLRRHLILRFLERRMRDVSQGGPPDRRRPDVIDGEYRREDDS